MKTEESVKIFRDAIRRVDWNADFVGADASIDKAYEALAAMEADNATLADENCQLRTQEISYQTQIAVKNEAIRQTKKWIDMGIVEFLPSWAEDAMRKTYDLIEAALTPDSGKVLVSVPELMLLRDTIRELLDVQNGCPLPKYKEMFDAANEQALVMEAWLNGRLAAKIKEASDANE